MIKSIEEIRAGVEYLREEGVQRGLTTGFKKLDELYTIKPGTFTIVLAAPGHGKSEFLFELLINQATKHDKKGIILSPETGNAEEVAMELVHKYTGKSAYKSNPYSCDDKAFYGALNWVNHHFAVVDDEEKSYSLDDLTKGVEEYERKNKCKYENIMAEPWNELNHKIALSENSGRQDLAIEDELTKVRRYVKKEQKHMFLSFHPSFQTLVKDSYTGISYYEMPKAREAAGGQATLRKAFSWINLWRPPIGVINPMTNEPYRENDLAYQIEKSKPKGIGKKGIDWMCWDWKRNRYYEELEGKHSYAFDHEKTVTEYRQGSLLPNSDF